VVIHRDSCGNLINFRKQPEKWLSVDWEDAIERDFSTQIQVETVNKTGVLAEVAAVIADSGSNIEEVSVINPDHDTSAMTFLLQVRDRTGLANIMRNVRKMPNVNRVSRDTTKPKERRTT
jgi:(p)ppGpp synthase/HD superfamily hydrolase